MALSSEHREEFNAQVNSFRSDRMKWPKDWQVDRTCYIAVADHLTAVENLLTVELAKVRVDDDLSYVDYGDFAEWWEEVRALLGPAATEGGG